MIISRTAFDMVLFFLFVAGVVVIIFFTRAKLPSLRFATAKIPVSALRFRYMFFFLRR